MPKKAPETRLACGGALQGMKSVNPCNVCMASLGRLELPTYGLGVLFHKFHPMLPYRRFQY